MQISENGLALIERFEGLRLRLYKDVAGRLTIGYGHLVRPGESFADGITEDQADALLRKDVQIAVDAVNRLVKVTLTQDQFDALCSFTYNLGAGTLEDSTLLRLLNAGDYNGAADQFLLWDHAAGEVNDGLLRRREAERSLFLMT